MRNGGAGTAQPFAPKLVTAMIRHLAAVVAPLMLNSNRDLALVATPIRWRKCPRRLLVVQRRGERGEETRKWSLYYRSSVCAGITPLGAPGAEMDGRARAAIGFAPR